MHVCAASHVCVHTGVRPIEVDGGVDKGEGLLATVWRADGEHAVFPAQVSTHTPAHTHGSPFDELFLEGIKRVLSRRAQN